MMGRAAPVSLLSRFALAGLLLGLAALARARPAWTFDLAGYQTPDGAITIERGGDEVDPYFALKALFVARSRGADDAGALDRFVEWQLARVRRDGRLERYSRQDGRWVATRPADADDIALALWMQAVLTRADGRALRPREASALERARDYLELKLLDRASNLYRPFADDNDALLMDNVEMLATLRSVEDLQRRRRDLAAADYWRLRATALASSIESSFRGIDTLLPAPTAGTRPAIGEPGPPPVPPPFYPDCVVAPFAWLHGVPRARKAARFDAWLALYGAAWRGNAEHDYPWGLIALAAWQEGRPDVAAGWRRSQEEQRRDGYWNVLEESAWQALAPLAADPT